jgi:hypothetical protein
MSISVKDIKNKTCNHQYTNGRNAGEMCKNKVSLKDAQNNYTKCSLHYKKPVQRKFEKVLTKLVIYEDDKEEKEDHRASDKEEKEDNKENKENKEDNNEQEKDFKKIQDDLINKLKIEKSKRQDILKILLEYFNDGVIN